MTPGVSAPSDAADIEQILIWTYHDQLAHILVENGVGLLDVERQIDDIEWQRVSPDGVAACMREAVLGVHIDRPPYQGVLHIAQDAVTVHAVVMMLIPSARDLIIENASKGTRPDWRPGARFHFEPRWKTIAKWTEGGLPKPKSFEIGSKYYYQSNHVRTSWCPVVPVDEPDSIERLRNRYKAWYAGLFALCEYFKDGDDLPYRTVSLGVPESPWNGLA